jgi:hypothetical protein
MTLGFMARLMLVCVADACLSAAPLHLCALVDLLQGLAC